MSGNNPNRVYLDTETTGLHPEDGKSEAKRS